MAEHFTRNEKVVGSIPTISLLNTLELFNSGVFFLSSLIFDLQNGILQPAPPRGGTGFSDAPDQPYMATDTEKAQLGCPVPVTAVFFILRKDDFGLLTIILFKMLITFRVTNDSPACIIDPIYI